MRFCCGDHPQMAFEKGQQEGGGFLCVAGCRGHAKQFHNIEYKYRQDHLPMSSTEKRYGTLVFFMYHPLNWHNENL